MKTSYIKAFVLLVFLSLLSSCPKDELKQFNKNDKKPVETDAVKTSFKTVRVDKYGISISVPRDWEVKKGGGNPVIFARSADAGPNGPSANVVIEDLSQRMAPYDYLEANLITMQISLPDLKILQRGTGLHSGIQMAWILYTYPREEVLMEVLTYCQTKEYTAYAVTTMCPAEDFDRHKGVFVKIGQSLRIK